MWITSDVQLPEEVLRAHSEKRLVVFAGAGISVGRPSSLPLFDQLAKGIGAELGVDLAPGASPDAFLGRLETLHSADVHARVHDLLSTAESKPNRLHRALATLALRVDVPRLVTTNYDLHLSRACRTHRPRVPEFHAPALPLGDDFTGLVYLHGSLAQQPRQLVVTDQDFGRAYLTQAWATRFLHSMFSKFVVLFVGYSHNDVIMTYLARGLPAGGERYVLTDEPDKDSWRMLDITPIGYGQGAGDHPALVRALDRWVRMTGMGLLGHRARMHELGAGPPSTDLTELSYMAVALNDPVRAQMFAEEASEAWLDWAEQQPALTTALVASTPTPAMASLCRWFGALVGRSAEQAMRGLATMQSLGAPLGPSAWFEISRGLRQLAKTDPAAVQPWLPLLLQSAPVGAGRDLIWLLESSAGSPGAVGLLMERILQPRVVLQPSIGETASGQAQRVRQELTFDVQEYWLRHVWEHQVGPELATLVDELLPVLVVALRRAHALQVQAGQGDRRHDPTSFRRSAIEPHTQDTHREPIHVVIDFTREAVEHLLISAPHTVSGILDGWVTADPPLLRRLAVHGTRVRVDIDEGKKLRWLLDSGLLWDNSCKHEVFLLIGQSLPQVSAALAGRLVRQALKDVPVDDHGEYELFNLLGWMVTHRPGFAAAEKALADVQSSNPDFLRRAHPDLNWYMVSGWSGSQPPMSNAAFVALLTTSPADAVGRVLSFADADPFSGGPSWSDALSMVTAASSASPTHGATLLSALEKDVPAEHQADMWRAVLNGWAADTFDGPKWDVVLECLPQCPIPDLLLYVARVLERGTGSGSTPTDMQIQALRALALELWEHDVPAQQEEPAEGRDWLSFSLNDWGGLLAQFWINTLVLTHDATAASGLDNASTAAIGDMLSSPTDHGGAARAILGSRLALLYQLDDTWTEGQLLPLFRWVPDGIGHLERAHQVWSGHLPWGRWNDRLLSRGLLESYLEAQQPLASSGTPEQYEHYLGHLAGIAVTSSIDPLETADYDWLRRFVVQASPEARRGWAEAVSEVLAEVPDPTAAAAWTGWMWRYWTQRLAARPLPLSPAEAGAMAGWLAHLGDHLPEAAALVLRAPAAIRPRWLARMNGAPVDEHPRAVASVLAHLLEGCEAAPEDAYDLEDLVLRLQPMLPAADLRPVVEAAISLNVPGATGWLP